MATPLILPPIANWTVEDAKTAVRATLNEDYRTNYQMLEDKDFWQNGKLWLGHRTGDSVTDAAILENVRQQHVADDIISECLENYASGLLGHEASVILDPIDKAEPAPAPLPPPPPPAPTDPNAPPPAPVPPPVPDTSAQDAQEQEIEDIMRVISRWWDSTHLWRKVRQTIKRSRYAALRLRPNVGRGDLRIWIPPINLDRIAPAPGRPAGRKFPTGLTLEDALSRIVVDDVEPDRAAVYTDPLTREQAAIVITGDQGSVNERVEVWTVAGTGDQRQTSVRVLTNDGAGQRTQAEAAKLAQTFAVNLGGRLPIIEVESDAVVTAPVRQLQSLLNFIITVLPSTVETAGFKQRYLTNVEPPGIWLTTAPDNSPPLATETIKGITYYKHRAPWTLGAHITAELIGVRTFDPTTKLESFATPGVTIETPTDPVYVTNAHETIAGLIYKRMRQGHFATSDAAQLSGVAYAQHRSQFESDLNNGKGAAETLVRETIETALAYAALMSSEAASILARYRIVVNLHPHAGPITADEQRVALELKTGRMISPETAMARVGIEDTIAEQAVIDSDPSQQADLSAKRAAACNAWQLAGAGAFAAAKLAGLTDDEAAMFVSNQKPPKPPPIIVAPGPNGGGGAVSPTTGTNALPPGMRQPPTNAGAA